MYQGHHWETAGDRHGNARDPLFLGAMRDIEFHQSRRARERDPASADKGDSEDRGGAWRFAQMNAVPVSAVAGEDYLLRVNCEYKDYIGEVCRSAGFNTAKVYRSEREDWIQAMILAGMGISFMPAFSPVIQGLLTRVVVDPEITRDVSLASIAAVRFSPAVATFVRAVQSYKWPSEHLYATREGGAE